MPSVISALGLPPRDVRAALHAASLAPSVHNSQPWRFVLRPDRVELHADPDRALPATDPEQRELRLSTGAALLNLRLALHELGIRPLVSLMPQRRAPDVLAVVRFGGRVQPDAATKALVAAISARRTNRAPFVETPVPPQHRHALVRAAEAERSWLHVVSTRDETAKLKGLVRRAHGVQLADPAVQAELAASTGSRAGFRHGVPPRSAGVRPEPRDEWAFRDFLPGEPHERHAGKDYESDPLIVIVCSFYDDPAADLSAGQAMQRVLLTATTLGLSASFLSQPIEVPPVRDELRRTLGGTLVPQTILRLGFGLPVPPTPRRPVEDLLLEAKSAEI
jgi:nitroreductase